MCSPTPPGDEGMISTADSEQWQLNISTNVVLPWFRFPPIFFLRVFSRPSERIGFIFTRAFMSGRFASYLIWLLWGGRLVLLTQLVCRVRVSGGCLDIGAMLVWEDQSGSPPTFLHPAGRERKKESKRILHKSFY